MLKEFAGEMGLLLWKSVHSVNLWAELTPAERKHAFLAGAHERRLVHLRSLDLEPALFEPLEVIAGILNSTGADPEAIARGCQQLSEWATKQGAAGTALAFMQAAALSVPTRADLAYAVGRLARGKAEYGRAETWFRQAITLARRSQDWETYARSHIGLGKLFQQRGRLPTARRAHLRAARSARRHGLREVHGMAMHDLAVIATQAGKVREAAHYIRAALDAYGPGHELLPAVAHDIAYIWMERGLFPAALRVFQVIVPVIQEPLHRLYLFGSIARAAGGAGERETFEMAWREVERLCRQPEISEGAAGTFLELAHGAASLGDWARAEEAAQRALALATERGEAGVRLKAEPILESIQHGRLGATALRAARRNEIEQVESLAGELIGRLEASPAVASS